MSNQIKAVHFPKRAGGALSPVDRFGPGTADRARAFHKSFPEYEKTPLVELNALAEELGVASIHVKDESYRFGLNAFKVLGGSYCIGNYIAKKLGVSITEQLHGEKPTHVFLQAGVGAMSGALSAYFASLYGEEERPVITIVEPDRADCISTEGDTDHENYRRIVWDGLYPSI